MDEKKICMQIKVSSLISTFTKFIDELVNKIQEIKLRKCAQLSMLWLRDLAKSEEEYELLCKIYRMDFE